MQEKAIRAIVAATVSAYAIGFSGLSLREIGKRADAINAQIYYAVIDVLEPEKHNQSILPSSFYTSLDHLAEIMATSIAKFHYDISDQAVSSIYADHVSWRHNLVRHLIGEERQCDNREFWNLVCKSEDGYDIVIDEYRNNARYIAVTFAEVEMVN